MFKLIGTIIVFIVVVQLVSAGLFKPPFEKINDNLVQQLPENQDLVQNLNAASKWRQELADDPKADKALIEALAILESLKDALNDPQCDEKMYEVVDKSAILGGPGCFDNRVPDSALYRLEYVVRHGAAQIAETCHEHHKNELDQRKQTLDLDLVVKAAKLPIMCYNKGPYAWNIWHRSICTLNEKNTKKSDVPDLLLAILSRMTTKENADFKYLRMVNDEKGQMVLRENEIERLVKQYIIEPCHYLRSKLGDLIALVYKDSVYMNAINKVWLRESKSPFSQLVPAFCQCNLFARAGDDTVIRQAIKMVPKATDELLVSRRDWLKLS